ncbi:MAG: hypothetical protein JO321_04945 [Solirubrobacterales bacterium]|nr:hypothetical protein [Solirubrobacterales bacterium]MBV9166219.1 hypothetical protein [Solirubrobacterales bacterium]MBV9534746.1 hypothetical protein [Solirubrobacterales bacterium]
MRLGPAQADADRQRTLLRRVVDGTGVTRDVEPRITLDVGNREALFERVLDHLVDLAMSGKPPSNDRMVTEPLMDNEIACIAGADNPGASDEPVAPAESRCCRAWVSRTSWPPASWVNSASRNRRQRDPGFYFGRPVAPAGRRLRDLGARRSEASEVTA